MEKKLVIVHVRLEESVAKTLKRLAAADDRKLSPYIGRVLKQHAEAAEASAETKAARGRKGAAA
jgi:hypothetical protein